MGMQTRVIALQQDVFGTKTITMALIAMMRLTGRQEAAALPVHPASTGTDLPV